MIQIQPGGSFRTSGSTLKVLLTYESSPRPILIIGPRGPALSFA